MDKGEMILHWFRSRAVRQAATLCRHVRRNVNAQRDRLSPEAVEIISGAIAAVQSEMTSPMETKRLRKRMAELEKAAAKWLPSPAHAATRENLEVILVAVAVAVAIHTFFLKPFKIPTGSMQPTLYGITAEDLRNKPGVRIPNGLSRCIEFCIDGNSYHHVVAEDDGMIEDYQPPRRILPFLPFIYRQSFKLGGKWYDVWSAWDRLLDEAGVKRRYLYHKGDDILKVKVFAGDHLFVDRLSYNFRRPARGEIIVFETRGITNPETGLPAMPQDQFYIKRLVALGTERVRIGDDRHLVVNDHWLGQTVPHFENVYSFDANQPPRENQYSGHLNDSIAARFDKSGLAPLFPDERSEFTLRPEHYMVMGDNTMNSLDSRTWGDFSRTNVIGKYFFVYWPFSRRFGWAAW